MKEIRERLKIFESRYPFANNLNPRLHKVILEIGDTLDKPRSVDAKMTEWRTENKLFDIVTSFIGKHIETDFGIYGMTCSECWGIICDNGDSIETHNHQPSQFSFAYYVNTPKGSSPLVFDTSGYKVKAESGKIVIFDSKLKHHVPKNKCDGRSLISGNFIYGKDSGVFRLIV
jgi:hypothetical protein